LRQFKRGDHIVLGGGKVIDASGSRKGTYQLKDNGKEKPPREGGGGRVKMLQKSRKASTKERGENCSGRGGLRKSCRQKKKKNKRARGWGNVGLWGKGNLKGNPSHLF